MIRIVTQTVKLIKKISICFLVLFAQSCIPLKIAPNIKGEKIVNAKKFKKDLPKYQGFIFEDTKNANEFYEFTIRYTCCAIILNNAYELR